MSVFVWVDFQSIQSNEKAIHRRMNAEDTYPFVSRNAERLHSPDENWQLTVETSAYTSVLST